LKLRQGLIPDGLLVARLYFDRLTFQAAF
jgi:hypothetical protein